MVDLSGRKVLFFRAHIDPGVHAMPKNAIHEKDVKDMEYMPGSGIYVVNNQDFEFIVPFANIQTIKLKAVEKKK